MPPRGYPRTTYRLPRCSAMWAVTVTAYSDDVTIGYEGPERLPVLAALLFCDPARSWETDRWMCADGTPVPAHKVRLVSAATEVEWELADAIRGEPGKAAVAGALLQLAAGTNAAALRLGLRDAFLPDGVPGVAVAERPAVFAAVYRKLGLPGLDADSAARAEMMLAELEQARP